jgi:hypothetical protein
MSVGRAHDGGGIISAEAGRPPPGLVAGLDGAEVADSRAAVDLGVGVGQLLSTGGRRAGRRFRATPVSAGPVLSTVLPCLCSQP